MAAQAPQPACCRCNAARPTPFAAPSRDFRPDRPWQPSENGPAPGPEVALGRVADGIAGRRPGWWLDDGGRDAVRRLLAESPLTDAGSSPTLRERWRRTPPPSVVLPGVVLATPEHEPSLTTLLRTAAPSVRAMAIVHPPAARQLAHVRGVGLAKSVINTLFAHGFFGVLGVVGPGALGLPPAAGAPCLRADIARPSGGHRPVARLVEMESCHWPDMQRALCLWRSSETGGPTC